MEETLAGCSLELSWRCVQCRWEGSAELKASPEDEPRMCGNLTQPRATGSLPVPLEGGSPSHGCPSQASQNEVKGLLLLGQRTELKALLLEAVIPLPLSMLASLVNPPLNQNDIRVRSLLLFWLTSLEKRALKQSSSCGGLRE